MYFSKVSIYMFFISYSASSHTSLKSRYIPHILMKRYVLTLTAYKFLDIGIVLEPTSHVEIAISDNRGNNLASCYVEAVYQETYRY